MHDEPTSGTNLSGAAPAATFNSTMPWQPRYPSSSLPQHVVDTENEVITRQAGVALRVPIGQVVAVD